MNLSFESLGLSADRIQQVEKLGFTTPTNIQIQAIPQLLAGRDVVGQSQTGTGKTAAFSLPILEQIDPENKTVQALILTPTRELAVQVCAAIKTFVGKEDVRVLPIYGGQSIDRQILQLNRGAQIIVGTPGRVIDLLDRGKLQLGRVRFVVLDEADEMLSMGFIEDVEKILASAPKERQTALFSATMPLSIRLLVKRFLNSPVTVTVEQPKAAPAMINQVAYLVPRQLTKAKALQPILELEDPETAIIFVKTRRTAAELTSQLQASGYSVDEYHGDLTQQARERLLTRFRNKQVRWVIATDIAARGLDVDHLTHVINFDLPDSAETYVHRIGRTGRAGKEGTAISLVQPFERRKQQQIERHVRLNLKVNYVPTRAQVEARQLEKLQVQVREVLAGERLASFLPIVRELSEEYDAQAIAAAALQMAYDTTRPAWLAETALPGEDERRDAPKPKINKRNQNSSTEALPEEDRPVGKPRISKRSEPSSASKNN
jgi:ATP-dependent RNA helicase DeaD